MKIWTITTDDKDYPATVHLSKQAADQNATAIVTAWYDEYLATDDGEDRDHTDWRETYQLLKETFGFHDTITMQEHEVLDPEEAPDPIHAHPLTVWVINTISDNAAESQIVYSEAEADAIFDAHYRSLWEEVMGDQPFPDHADTAHGILSGEDVSDDQLMWIIQHDISGHPGLIHGFYKQKTRHTQGWEFERTTGSIVGYLWWDDNVGEGDITLISNTFDALPYVSRIDAMQDFEGLARREVTFQTTRDASVRPKHQATEKGVQSSALAEAYRVVAKDMHQEDGTCEIDDAAVVAFGDDPGAYVAAWVWVPQSNLPEEFHDEQEDEDLGMDEAKSTGQLTTYTVIVRELRPGPPDPLIYTVQMENLDDEDAVLMAVARDRCKDLGMDEDGDTSHVPLTTVSQLAASLKLCFAFEGDLNAAEDWRD